MASPVIKTTDGLGYTYDETAVWWKDEFSRLPCFAALQWPDYASTIVEDRIGGRRVVIQLWKGWCQRFLGSSDYPGGIGAEVGIYERLSSRPLPKDADLAFLPPTSRAWFLAAYQVLRNDGDVWWPVTDLNVPIDFELVNPVTGRSFFRGDPEVTYWRNKWMEPESYPAYKRAQGKRWPFLPWWVPGNSRTPVLAVEYTLKYKIDGKAYADW